MLYDVINMSFGRIKSKSDTADDFLMIFYCTISYQYCSYCRVGSSSEACTAIIRNDEICSMFGVMSSIRHHRRSVARAQSNSTGIDVHSTYLPNRFDG
jgi:hypothetical protein